ncbi:UNVERIFIED_CONTAM: DUF4199 domain-containing protein [Prevotella sp. 15_C9]
MNYMELRQLRAFAWYDGIYLAIVWAASFACFLAQTWLPMLGDFSSVLILVTPFFAGYRLKLFRDVARDGIISYRDGFFYSMRMFFNATWLFSLAQWAYMAFLDRGRMLRMVTAFCSTPEFEATLKEMNIRSDTFLKALPEALEPYSLVVNGVVWELLLGVVISLIIAAIFARKVKPRKLYN